MNFISSMLIAAILISITISLLIIMTMISIIGIRKELRIKNLYTRRMCINYPYNVQLSDLELEVYDFLYFKSPKWIDEKKISASVGADDDKSLVDALDSLEEKGLVFCIDGLYSVKFKNEQ